LGEDLSSALTLADFTDFADALDREVGVARRGAMGL